MPLQASTIFLRADQRRAALNPPLPPISHDQVLHGELVTLIFVLKITSLSSSNLLSIYQGYQQYQLHINSFVI